MADTTEKKEQLVVRGEELMAAPTSVSAWTRFRSYIWDSDTHLKSPEERKFLLKLDLAVLTTLCLGWFMKYLDQSNLGNAYVSGMKEDLNFKGNDYTNVVVCYTIAYALLQVPSTIIVSKVRPSYWLFACEIGWGIFTFAQAGAQSVKHMFVFRVMVALFESSFFPCALLLLGAWYTPVELAKRTAIFHMTAAVGSSFGGYLQVAVYKNLDGHAGLAGWRWLYIVCGCMTVPAALLCLFLLPDYPHTTRAFYLTEADIAIANARSAKNKKKDITGAFTLSTFKRAFRRWEYYAFIAAYVSYGQSIQPSGYYGIWLKFKGFSLVDRNLLPTITSYVQIVTIFTWGFMSDFVSARKGWRTGRWLLCVLPLLWANFPLAVLSTAQNHIKLCQAAFNMGAMWTITSVLYSWANETFASEPEVRALVIGSMNGFQYASNSAFTATVWQQTKGPRWIAGMTSAWAFAIVGAGVVTTIWFLQMRQFRREQAIGISSGASEVEAQHLDKDQIIDSDQDDTKEELSRETSGEKQRVDVTVR